jgi:ppGpp synthetase/RelA/SpoT-type nucleotidyltranferase
LDIELRQIFKEDLYRLIEGPVAFTWDDESFAYFRSIGFTVKRNPRMYTSVHYVIEASRASKIRGEIQVRTLAEELWGEVDHHVNYPDQSPVDSCREQIKVLARFTSGCSRLVDSIFETHRSGTD